MLIILDGLEKFHLWHGHLYNVFIAEYNTYNMSVDIM